MTGRAKPLACDRCGTLPALRTVEDELSDGTTRYQYVYQCVRCHYRPAIYCDTQTRARKAWNQAIEARGRLIP